jgi:hypothetical protein
MGKTYKKLNNRYDDEISSGRSGKHARHSNGKKTGGMRTLNSYVEEDDENFDLNEDSFNDEVEIDDDVYIQYIKQS